MDFLIAADTDIGNTRKTNQDSVAVMVADMGSVPVAFGVICDGMGGLAKGELASATMIHSMTAWFRNDFPSMYRSGMEDGAIRDVWTSIIRRNNEAIQSYGAANQLSLGTTISAILITPERYYIVNVGDTRIYEIGSTVKQLTDDQTVVAQELRYGRITPEQAENDPRGSVLLQCVGASRVVNPEFFFGAPLQNATYLLCSDGFRHKIGNAEIMDFFNAAINTDADIMKTHIRQLIELNKQKQEKDNITAALIRTF
ncbi:PP2C family serine/threonine-protein phosphatase [uncultured Ruminococcus sp.]|uniref:PP2C family protein-serine/threonine phosphatase n=1 Tax=uncultured Ruminococcus sp. TaxID=165186 RepID=UPI00292E948D|nr:PP2C family serine/threonine-protein phosphatase [uncultured Ruminococcus sp.]